MRCKGKGSEFERSTSGRLSLWVTNLQREDVFWRSAMSGGRATFRGRQHGLEKFSGCAGDITSVRAEGNLLTSLFIIECKFWREVFLDYFVFERKGGLVAVWENLVQRAEDVKKLPMLVAKKNFKPALIGVTTPGVEILRKGGKIEPLVYVPGHDLNIFAMTTVLTDTNFDKIRLSLREKADALRGE